MQKRILIVICVFITFFCYPSHANCEKLEMIVLMDTSISVLPIYDFLEGYLVRDILEGHLKPGDSFHLLSFSNTPEIEISKEIREDKDKENIIKYIDILQPMGKYTDLIMALKYLYTFTMDLPLNNKKCILILTDGIHDPPPGSPYFFDDKQLIISELEKISQAIRRHGWDIHLLEIPGKYTEETSIRTSYLSMLSENLGIPFNKYSEEKKDNISNIALGVPSIEFPEHLGEVGYRFKAPFKIVNFNEKTVIVKLTGILWNGTNILEKDISLSIQGKKERILKAEIKLPDDMEFGTKKISIQLVFSDNLRIYPDRGFLSFELNKNSGKSSCFWYVILYVILGLAAVFVVTLVIKTIRRKIEATVRTDKTYLRKIDVESAKGKYRGLEAESAKTESEKYLLKKKSRPIEMYVIGQNKNIGGRNIHWIGEGVKRSVGGKGSSYYLIFLLPLPGIIAEIYCKDKKIIFEPIQKNFFPYLKKPLYNCLDEKIDVISENGQKLTIVFSEWISPLEKINRIMHLTDKQGLPDFNY